MQTSDYLEQLVQDKSDLVDNLTEKGIEDLTGDETFTELVPRVLDIEAGGQNKIWVRPDSWWDTRKILSEATERTDNSNNVVYPAYIILFDDTDKQTTFNKTGSGKALQGDSYLTSDGTWYGTTSATHTWDQSKDKASDGYKTRYVIVYTRSTTLSAISLTNFPCIEVILGNITATLSMGSQYSPYNEKIMNVETFNESNISINSNAFRNCSNLLNVSFPNLTTINIGVFLNCRSLQSISFPKVTSIGNNAFNTCYSLQNVSFPETTYIGSNAFNACYSLQNVSFPKVTSISSSAFGSCYSLQNVSFPEVTSIVGSAFSGCYSLQSISFPELTSIGDGAFSYCYSLQSISFPELTSISYNCFGYCYSLTNIILPNTITTINVSSTSPTFGQYLKSIILPNNFNLDLNIARDISLTHGALVDILDKLKDLTGTEETHTITLGATNEAKLSTDELAVITSKGWTLGS